MAYTIIRSNGTTLTTISDGSVNTTSTSLGLPGRNYPSYGQILDTNFVRLTENFANTAPPPNPIKGQLWYNTTLSTLNICPADGTTNAADWVVVATTSSGGSATLGNVTVTGNIIANNASIGNSFNADNVTCRIASVSSALTATLATFTTANTTVLNVTTINGTSTTNTLNGTWNVTGNITIPSSYTLSVPGSLSSGTGIKCDNYMYANGQPFNPSGTYTNANVSNFLQGTGGVTQFTGNIAPTKVTTTRIEGGGVISGIWTLDNAVTSRIQANYADLAERYEADDKYEPGTVVELGGDKEVTIASELTDNVFGVVSTNPAYLMNAMAGEDDTHPAIALTGRVQVKVVGKVKKGDRLVSAGDGIARAAKRGEANAFNTIGRSLVEKGTDGIGTVEAIVSIR